MLTVLYGEPSYPLSGILHLARAAEKYLLVASSLPVLLSMISPNDIAGGKMWLDHVDLTAGSSVRTYDAALLFQNRQFDKGACRQCQQSFHSGTGPLLYNPVSGRIYSYCPSPDLLQQDGDGGNLLLEPGDTDAWGTDYSKFVTFVQATDVRFTKGVFLSLANSFMLFTSKDPMVMRCHAAMPQGWVGGGGGSSDVPYRIFWAVMSLSLQS